MVSRIHLVRHGVSTHVHDGGWVDAAGAQRFLDRYDAAGIRDEAPPAFVVEAARNSRVLAASTLVRAIESVRRLAPEREIEVTPLLCELPFDSPARWPIRLPVAAWGLIDFAVNGYRIWRRSPVVHLHRASEAADWLVARASSGGSVLAVTHGGFRRFLRASLFDRGWKVEPPRQDYRNWSVWSFRSP